MQTKTAESVLTVAEVSKRLRCDPRTVRDLIAAGRLRAVRLGRDYRIAAESLRALEVGAAAPAGADGSAA